MKFRWWIAVLMLVTLLPLQPGCGSSGELPMEASPDEPLDVDDPMEDMKVSP